MIILAIRNDGHANKNHIVIHFVNVKRTEPETNHSAATVDVAAGGHVTAERSVKRKIESILIMKKKNKKRNKTNEKTTTSVDKRWEFILHLALRYTEPGRIVPIIGLVRAHTYTQIFLFVQWAIMAKYSVHAALSMYQVLSACGNINGICIYYTYLSSIRITYEIWTFSVLLILLRLGARSVCLRVCVYFLFYL